jgi:hypothetical protein
VGYVSLIDDGIYPNNPRLPLLKYRNAVPCSSSGQGEGVPVHLKDSLNPNVYARTDTELRIGEICGSQCAVVH